MKNNVITTTCKMMSNVAIVNEMTAVRANVIANRTNSLTIGIAKSAMINELKSKMKNGVAHFFYCKKDGSLREAFGTINAALAEATTTGTGISRENYATCAYYDCQVGGWRSFRWETLVQVL
ncbi:MAG: SH3 beta-barrel fold-containing protein [Bacteroidales bacterium]|nr:SH3 beta-barrel fold-containing protein [Bacteroidales bacterium]